MDNLAHTLFATALAKTPLGKRSPLATPAMVLAANLPDLDGALRFLGSEAYLVYHRGITHSLIGVAAQILAMTWCVAWAERRWFPGAGGRPMLPIAIGLLSHPLLDFLNSYGIRPLLPFDGRWVHGDVAYIVDPWLLLIFGGATAIAGARTRWGSALLAIAAVGTSALFYDSGRATAFLQWAWPSGIVAIAAARALGVGRARPTLVVAAALALAAAYLLAVAALGAGATQRARELLEPRIEPGERIVATARSPWPADPFRWTVFLQTDRAIYRQVLARDGEPAPFRRYPNHLELAAVRAALETPAGRAWLGFARLPMAQVDEDANGTVVYLIDARYGTDRDSGWASRAIRLPAPPR